LHPSFVIATPNYASKKLPISNAQSPADISAWKFDGDSGAVSQHYGGGCDGVVDGILV
jgi:hypothetical protein